MKTVAFVFAVCILTVGVVGIIAPSELVWIAQHFDTSGPFYVLAAIRIAFGVILVSVAPASRAPKALRILGFLIVVLGIAAAIAGLLAIESARASIEWWMQQGSGVRRLTAIPVIALGGFIAYACAPRKWFH